VESSWSGSHRALETEPLLSKRSYRAKIVVACTRSSQLLDDIYSILRWNELWCKGLAKAAALDGGEKAVKTFIIVSKVTNYGLESDPVHNCPAEFVQEADRFGTLDS